MQVARHTLRHADGRRLHVYGRYGGEPLPEETSGAPSHGQHLRHDALTDSWIGVSPARNTRPLTHAHREQPACPLCPGGPEVPFEYDAAVFDNRFPSLHAAPPDAPTLEGATAPARGRCEVVLYTSTHVGSLATLDPEERARVVAIWRDRSDALWAEPDHALVLVFENRGEDVGATLSHPHGQIYAFDRLPPITAQRTRVLHDHRAAHDTCLTCTVVAGDDAARERQVLLNPSFVVAVPFAARWPYEVHVRARRHGLRRLGDLTADEQRDLAEALSAVVAGYDDIFAPEAMAYMMVGLEAPRGADGAPEPDWHLAFEFLPPNRGRHTLKMRASVETATAFFINDTVPETTAAELATAIGKRSGVPVPDVEIVPGPDAASVGVPTPGTTPHP